MHTSARFISLALVSLLATACGKQEAPPAPKAEASKAAAGPAASKGPLKVGFVYVSPTGDAGWTSQHH
ncbi:MAG: BMP family ABC transporter substrate-binding protein, partial [Burkholderiaceae bacterium]